MQARKTVQDKPERNCHDPAGQRRCTGDDTGPAALDLDDSIARRDREGTAEREKSAQSKNQIAHFIHFRPSHSNPLVKLSQQPKIRRTFGPANCLPRQTGPLTYEAAWPRRKSLARRPEPRSPTGHLTCPIFPPPTR